DTWRLFAPFELVWAGGRLGRAAMQVFYWWFNGLERFEARAARQREEEDQRVAERAALREGDGETDVEARLRAGGPRGGLAGGAGGRGVARRSARAQGHCRAADRAQGRRCAARSARAGELCASRFARRLRRRGRCRAQPAGHGRAPHQTPGLTRVRPGNDGAGLSLTFVPRVAPRTPAARTGARLAHS